MPNRAIAMEAYGDLSIAVRVVAQVHNGNISQTDDRRGRDFSCNLGWFHRAGGGRLMHVQDNLHNLLIATDAKVLAFENLA